ncbi:crinkler effector protein 8-like isoform X1 [Cornus florida]|uniref:crinkler effector protein 8-like isoform X1 n=1 Tax=Cornus florida TaxID=4283 RepID=UPI002897690D|nr:crinkler effector protein 8-like isoform X1 [Cornus florida]
MVLIRKPSTTSSSLDTLQDQWPNLTGLIRNFCLWRGEETDQLRSGDITPSTSILLKHMWTYMDIPYILGYYAVGHRVTFCALSRLHARTIKNDLYTVDLSVRAERLNVLVPCWRIAGLLTLLADRCSNCKLFLYSDFDRIHMGNGDTFEMTPNMTTRFFTKLREWAAVKEIYGFLDNKIPHAEVLVGSSERELALVFNSRGFKIKPQNCDQLVKALIHVTEALVELHKLSFMHRDLGWEKVIMRIRNG